jgi:hypothetical protein
VEWEIEKDSDATDLLEERSGRIFGRSRARLWRAGLRLAFIGDDRAAAAGKNGAQRRQNGSRFQGLVIIFLNDPQHEPHPPGHAQLTVETLAVSVDRMRRDLEFLSDGAVGQVVEYAFDNS